MYEYSERGFGIKVNLACAFCRVQTKGVDRLDLGQAVRIISAIENSRPQMRFEKVFLKQRFDNASRLDMSATVVTAQGG